MSSELPGQLPIRYDRVCILCGHSFDTMTSMDFAVCDPCTENSIAYVLKEGQA